MSGDPTLQLELSECEVAVGADVAISLRVSNRSPDAVTSLHLRVSGGPGGGLRVLGPPVRQIVLIPSGADHVIPIKVRVEPGRQDLYISGVNYRRKGRTETSPDRILSLQVTGRPTDAQPERQRPRVIQSTARDLVNQPPFDLPPGFGSKVFVSFSGDIVRRMNHPQEDWRKRLSDSLSPILRNLPARRVISASGEIRKEPFRLFFYDRPHQGAMVGDPWMSGLAREMYAAPAAILLLEPSYMNRDTCWNFEAPYLVWRHVVTGMPLIPVRISDMSETRIWYPVGDEDREFDLTTLYDERKGSPAMLEDGHDSASLQWLHDNKKEEIINRRLNGLSRQLAMKLQQIIEPDAPSTCA